MLGTDRPWSQQDSVAVVDRERGSNLGGTDGDLDEINDVETSIHHRLLDYVIVTDLST